MLFTIKNVKNINSKKLGDLIFQAYTREEYRVIGDGYDYEFCTLTVYFRDYETNKTIHVASIGLNEREVEGFINNYTNVLHDFTTNYTLYMGRPRLNINKTWGISKNAGDCYHESGIVNQYRFEFQSACRLSLNSIIRDELKAYNDYGFSLAIKNALQNPLIITGSALTELHEDVSGDVVDYMTCEQLSDDEIIKRYSSR